MKHDRKFNPVAKALRDAGFVPLPRLWIKGADMPTIHLIANQYKDEVTAIRRSVRDNDYPSLKKERRVTREAKDDISSHDPEGMDPTLIDWPGMN